MSTTILTDEQIRRILNAEADRPGHRTMLDYARAIEQAVLQTPEVRALRRDAERYRYARDNIMEDHELPGCYYLSDEGEYWDKTIDAARENT